MTKSTNAKGFKGLVQRKPHAFKKVTISLYCTNRTSLRDLFYATRAGIYTRAMEATGKLWNIMEGDGKRQKVMEGNRRSWNLMEVSGKCENIPWVSYVSEGEADPKLSTKKEGMNYVSGRQFVTCQLSTTQ